MNDNDRLMAFVEQLGIGLITLGVIGAIIIFNSGCAGLNEAWMRSYVAVHDAADAVLTKTNAPSVLPVVPPDKPSVDLSGDLVDPQPEKYNATTLNYADVSRRGFISSCECSIEPATGLMIRCPVWVPSRQGWYYLSDPFKGGRIKLEGTKSNGTLVCEPFQLDGATWECIGATDHEIDTRKGENLEWARSNLITKGNRIPYQHKRVYLVWVCHKAK